ISLMSTLSYTLKARCPGPWEVSTAATLPSSFRSHTPAVLVADDDPGILAIVSRLLELNGFIPLVATNGNDALRFFDEVEPALVILDMLMPGKTGLEVCREIRSRSNAPVIMLTAVDDEAEVARALREGADDYVRKPFGAREL